MHGYDWEYWYHEDPEPDEGPEVCPVCGSVIPGEIIYDRECHCGYTIRAKEFINDEIDTSC